MYVLFILLSFAIGFVAVLFVLRHPAEPTPSGVVVFPHVNSTMLVLHVGIGSISDDIDRCVRSFHRRVAAYLFICADHNARDTVPLFLWHGDCVFVLPLAPPVAGVGYRDHARNLCKRAAVEYAAKHNVDWAVLAEPHYTVELREHNLQTDALYDVNTIQVHHSGGYLEALPLLIRTSALRDHCRYRLWAHEFLDCSEDDDATLLQGHYSGIYMKATPSGVSTIQLDITVLEQWMDKAKKEKDLLGRALYYLARDYEENGQYERAMDTYSCHNREQTFTNYQFYARYRVGMVHLRRNDSMAAVEHAMLDAQAGTPDGYFRREPLYQLALAYRSHGEWARCLLYATAALGAPPVDYARMPIFLEPALYEPGNGNPILGLWRFCSTKLKI